MAGENTLHNSTDKAGAAGAPPPGAILPLRSFWVEIDNEGEPFTWQGDAVTEAAAFKCALHDLERFYPTLNRDAARMVVCIEREAP